jgi:hypothetical protein
MTAMSFLRALFAKSRPLSKKIAMCAATLIGCYGPAFPRGFEIALPEATGGFSGNAVWGLYWSASRTLPWPSYGERIVGAYGGIAAVSSLVRRWFNEACLTNPFLVL